METQNMQSIIPLEARVLITSPIRDLEDSGHYVRCNGCDALIPANTAYYKKSNGNIPYCDSLCSIGIESN